MSTVASELPAGRPLLADRIRGLYNGVGYVVAAIAVQVLWWASADALPSLLAHDAPQALHAFAASLGSGALAVVAGPLVIPVAVNLAPRAGPGRLPWLFATATAMVVWCRWIEGFGDGSPWAMAGAVLDGYLTTGLMVGVCAYHADWRRAADSRVRAGIRRAGVEAELQRARLRALRIQIEPHFLFNTLSVVRALARDDRAATVGLLDNLMRCFEAALPRLHGNDVRLSQELDLVSAYLAVWQARLGPRLAFEIEASEDSRSATIPAMALLTLVENALQHGIGPMVQGGSIRIVASRKADALVLEVADTGRGLDLRNGCGTGLANIGQRLLIMHGPAASLSLQAAQPHGVVARITIPAH